MSHVDYEVKLREYFGGELWEIRNDTEGNYSRMCYCAHLNCSFEAQDVQYLGLWSWEHDDGIESDNGLPWCHFCHLTIPDELQAIMAMLW